MSMTDDHIAIWIIMRYAILSCLAHPLTFLSRISLLVAFTARQRFLSLASFLLTTTRWEERELITKIISFAPSVVILSSSRQENRLGYFEALKVRFYVHSTRYLRGSTLRQGELTLSEGSFEGFTVHHGHPYCEACHIRLRNPKCKKCKRAIRFVDLLPLDISSSILLL